MLLPQWRGVPMQTARTEGHPPPLHAAMSPRRQWGVPIGLSAVQHMLA